ncbi:MAG: HD domain-containing protein [Coriobacteriia bacterium]|nr:HD domain-containing protein [Actinomycetota bacterium]MDZ4167437.1 HD domain-containing protein [Coriobacteriia bacterium]
MSDEHPIIPGEQSGVRAPHSDREGAAAGSDIERITAEVKDMSGTQTFSSKQLARARELLTRLYSLRRACRLYPPGHPAMGEAAGELHDVLALYHAEGTDVPLTFFEEEVLLGSQVLAEDSVLFDQLIRDISAIGAGSITFLRDVTLAEIERFGPVLGARAEDVASVEGGVSALVERANVPHIVVSTVSIVRDDVTVSEGDADQVAKATYTGAVDLLRELERLIRSNHVISAGHVKSTVRSLVDNILRNRFAMLELSGLKSFDEYTFFHSVNVAILSLALGSKLTRDYRFLSSLGVGALLHDIGKMSVDLATLNKEGPLTSDEWADIRHHPVHGAEMTALTNGLDRASIVCVLEHHMRYDLTGYPQREPKRAQHISSRIVAVADAYDAMTSQRPYSAPRMQDEAMGVVVRNAGTALDPTLVRLFVDLLGYFPPRSVVLLSTGEAAIVVSPSPSDPARPVVRIIADRSGAMIEPVDLDLSITADSGGRSALRCLDPAGLNVDIADFL